MSDELARLDATAQAELIRRGEVRPEELVEAALARIERLNPELNAVIHRLDQRARATAARPLPDAPFRGVPLLVKDAVCQTEGDPYHLGMRFLKERNHVSDHDTELARRFRAAGFVIVGKTNTPELALSVTTEPLAYGATHNPWNLAHSTGGSSGGSAAAVAAGIAAVAHANDMGGSIRLPAAFCGLVGLKPTRARGSLAPDFGEYWGPLTHEHVVTRSVRDCAGVLDAISGPACGDPYCAQPPVRPFAQEVGRDPGRLRIGFVAHAGGQTVHPDCVAAVERTASRLADLGHHVEGIELPALHRPEVGPWIPAAVAHDLDRWAARFGEAIGQDDVEPLNWLMAETGRGMSAVQYVAATEVAWSRAREIGRPWSEGLDVLLTPTAALPPPELGWLAPDIDLGELMPRLALQTHFTMPFNLTGQPAISLPLHWNEQGLPVGVQLVAGYAREDVLLRLSAQLEEAHPWRDRRPPIHA